MLQQDKCSALIHAWFLSLYETRSSVCLQANKFPRVLHNNAAAWVHISIRMSQLSKKETLSCKSSIVILRYWPLHTLDPLH